MASALHKCVTYLLRHLPTYLHPRTHIWLKYLALSGLICSLWASFLISAAHIHYKITEIDARNTVHSVKMQTEPCSNAMNAKVLATLRRL